MNNYSVVNDHPMDLLTGRGGEQHREDTDREDHDEAFLGRRLPDINSKVTKFSEDLLLYMAMRFRWTEKTFNMATYIANSFFDICALFGLIGFIIAVCLI